MSDISRAQRPAAVPGREAEGPAPARVPDEAFVAVRPPRPGVVVRLKRGLPLRHSLMLALAAALMVMGGVRAQRHPMHKAIVIPAPALQGSVIT